MYLWLHWVFAAAWTFSSCTRGLLIAAASLAVDHRLQGTQALVGEAWRLGNCRSRALQHRLNSCGTWILVASGHVGSSLLRG